MPLFSEHIANMYYGSSSPYTGSHYSYSSSVSPIGSYSASYLNPGGSYSNHSSIGGYSRAPSTSRWITSSGRNYAPMLSTISERASGSPIRINSPRRIPLSSRTYGTPNYTPRPVNINTADIDVSKDKYRHKVEPYTPHVPNPPPPTSPPENSNDENVHSPFMPRVDGKTETTIDSPVKVERSTIKRGRTVVRLYTIKRKERDSPRKPTEEQKSLNSTNNQEAAQTVDEDSKIDEKEFMKWREKLSDDLAYKDKREKKTLGAKLVEKFIVKDNNEKRSETPTEGQNTAREDSEILPTTSAHVTNLPSSKCLDRRCSLELMAEQANLLDSLIRSENLSTATLDLSKVGTVENKTNLQAFESIKRRKPDNLPNPIKTTKSDHSLHQSLKSHQDPKNYCKRRSIKRSSSGSSIRRLDSITELPKEINNPNLPAIEESIPYIQKEDTKPKAKTKLKTKITGSVEVSPPMSPLKFIVEKVTVEEKPRNQKKEISYSSEVEEVPATCAKTLKHDKEQNPVKKVVTNNLDNEKELPSPEPENGNFWDKIGKRETVYLMKRKQNLNDVKEKSKRAFFWFPEDGEEGTSEQSSSNNTKKSDDSIEAKEDENENTSTNKSTVYGVNEAANILHKDINNEVVLDVGIVEQKISAKDTDIIRKEDRPAESITITDTKSTITPVLDAIKCGISDDSTLEILSKINDNTLQPTTIGVCQKKSNIGKSASLETLNDEKTKVPSQKKTKSEKTKKILKTGMTIEEKSIQPIDLQLINNTNVFAKSNIQQTQNKEDKDIVLEDIVRTSDKQEMVNNITTYSDKQKISCPIHPKGLQKVQEFNVESEKTKIPCPVHSLGIQKIIVAYDSTTDNNEISRKDLPESKLASVTQVTMCGSTDDQKENSINISLINSESKNDVVSKVNVIKEAVTKISNTNYTVECNNSKSNNNMNDLSKNNKTEQGILNASKTTSESKEISSDKVNNDNFSNKSDVKLVNSELRITNDNLKVPFKILNKAKSKDNITINKSSKCDEKNKDDESKLALNDSISYSEEPSTSSAKTTTVVMLQNTADSENNSMNSSSLTTIDVPDKQVVVKSQDIPNADTGVATEARVQSNEKTRDENKADNITQKDEVSPENEIVSPPEVKTPKRPVKEEKAVRPLIATPRPLQKKPPQVIHSSDSSDTSSEEESSEEDNDSDSSESCGEFYECENNPDGRTSTGSNDSGFDSSAPASPATFSQIKKDCDVNCHRKCEKLTANLCGVNQRLLVEALASRTASKKGGEASATASSSAPAQANNTDILEQELEQSTAYDIFRKTGRFTPPARSIPRFRKYTVEDFQFIKVLGKGSFGKVLLAELRDTEYYYAVKCLKKDVVLEDDDVECTLIERKVLALGTNHPYLCHLFATFQTDSHLFFVMEYLNGGDLMFHIQQSGRFPEARGRFYAAEIVSGLKFLHKRGIVYRDLKLDNILLDYEGHVRIADFGMCKLQIYLDKTADTFCGTPDYMAPEIIKGLKYNQTVDWWSFGVLLYEMLIGQSPFSGCDEDELFWSICNEMPSYPRFLSHEALTILTRLLDKDARTRLGGTECMHGDIRDQDFFHTIHWDRLERRELETPFRPRVRHPMDTQYFDRAFTGERPRLTAVEPQVLRSMDQEPFRGFSYTNPNTTDR